MPHGRNFRLFRGGDAQRNFTMRYYILLTRPVGVACTSLPECLAPNRHARLGDKSASESVGAIERLWPGLQNSLDGRREMAVIIYDAVTSLT